jgi:transcription elongation factor Elf1
MGLKKKQIRNIDNIMDRKARRTIAQSDRILLFYSFECPYCEVVNVSSKEFKKEVVLCSNSGCKRIIVIDNFKDIA